MCIGEDAEPEDWDLNDLNGLLLPMIPLEPIEHETVQKMKKNELKQICLLYTSSSYRNTYESQW